ncbi:HesA/MoeB/ThiF family protein [Flavobacterium sp. AG291]|uniref:HesA/MoeB/ThiF family protein n=1 Tax=Flavobacterium sp. AG291 TaxID=2184000 RepID=UPI000E0B3D98|nr:HesA/MoeB/ThiF family protein [Flavobacterium sp. AG291]RDI10471.1 adenylyltransferase/sulfurtransferase [Flavobacterium sp. AG291]
MISIDSFLRYNRQMMLSGIGEAGQEKIQQTKVLVIGAGGLGCPVLQYLAAAGIGTLGIVDFDIVELHNLHRQILYNDEQIGESKAVTAKKVLQKLNPGLNYNIYDRKLTGENAADLIRDFDMVIDGSDNFSTRYLVNDTCVLLNKPLVYGSILNFEGQMAVFNHKGSKNLRDLFPSPPDPKDVPNCSLNGVIGTLPGILGSMMAHETIKLITDLSVLHNEMIVYDTLQWKFIKVNF